MAIQFGVWAYALSHLIPFSGSFLMPVVYILDPWICFVILNIQFLELLPWLMGSLGGLAKYQEAMHPLGVWSIPLQILGLWIGIVPLVLPEIIIGSFWVKGKIRKKAPDLQLVLSGKKAL